MVMAGCKDRADALRPAAQTPLVVFAAASLRDVFTALGAEFERAHPGAALTFSFAGSQELRAQIEQGAQADVFASADLRHMDALVAASLMTLPVIFARNEPVVVVSREAKQRVREFAHLPRAARIVLGATEVPIGRYTAQILDSAARRLGPEFRAEVERRVVSRELNVRQVLAKVSLGEAEAAVVYRSDALAAGAGDPEGSVVVVPIPAELNAIAEYPIAVAVGSAQAELARAWIAFLLSPSGQRALSDAGFLPAQPPEPGGAP
jgi:molybdate transport system substrate-binding protein